jgi:hypothetical protein
MRVRRLRLVVSFSIVASVVLWSDVLPARGAPPPTVQREGSAAGRAGDPRLMAREAGCVLFTERARTSRSGDCTGCHRASASGHPHSHVVDVDYAAAAGRRSALRPMAEVVRRGVFLPENELRCVTCHDGASPWAHALALPPGTAATLAVEAADPRTFHPDEPRAAPRPGDRVSAKPLCLACHPFD